MVESERKVEIRYDKLYDLLKKAYKEGYSSYEMIESGLESYDPDAYVRWALLSISSPPPSPSP